MKQGIQKHTKRRVMSLIKVQIVTQKQTFLNIKVHYHLIETQSFNVVQVFFLIMSHHNVEQISEATLCQLHRDMFGINGNPLPSSANARFMEMLNKKDLIWELMFHYNPQFLHIGHTLMSCSLLVSSKFR
jgi:UTP:GlnB (protein PII) uridylyltransferase